MKERENLHLKADKRGVRCLNVALKETERKKERKKETI